MSAERSGQFRSAARSVLRWCATYTRGLDPAVAAARQDEIASDLHEHASWAAAQGMSARRLAWSVRSRAVLGAAADLAWRRQQARTATASVRLALRANAAILAATIVTAAVLAGTGIFAITRVIRAIHIGDIGYIPSATYAITGLTVIALAAEIQLFHRRRRAWGAALLIVPALLTFPLAGSILWHVSASTVVAFLYAPWWPIAALVAGISLTVLCTAAAAYWFSAERRLQLRLSEGTCPCLRSRSCSRASASEKPGARHAEAESRSRSSASGSSRRSRPRRPWRLRDRQHRRHGLGRSRQ